MHKLPNRPAGDVSQTFSNGYVDIYKTTNGAQAGYKAVEKLMPNPLRLRYDEQRTGVTRYYAAKQANVQIERVLRVPDAGIWIDTQSVAVTEDGMQYRIEQVQTVIDSYPRSLDISLSRIVQRLEVV